MYIYNKIKILSILDDQLKIILLPFLFLLGKRLAKVARCLSLRASPLRRTKAWPWCMPNWKKIIKLNFYNFHPLVVISIINMSYNKESKLKSQNRQTFQKFRKFNYSTHIFWIKLVTYLTKFDEPYKKICLSSSNEYKSS